MVHPRYTFDRRPKTQDAALDTAIRAMELPNPQCLSLVTVQYLRPGEGEDEAWWATVERD